MLTSIGYCINPYLIFAFYNVSQPSSIIIVLILLPQQISRLIYTNSGNAILALSSDAIHLLWKWQRSDRNSSGKVRKCGGSFFRMSLTQNLELQWYCLCILVLHPVGYCQCLTTLVATINWHPDDQWHIWRQSWGCCDLLCSLQKWFLCDVSIRREDFVVQYDDF